jgi:hypothetical protein
LFEAHHVESDRLFAILHRVEALFLAGEVDEFREASVSVRLVPRERFGRCVAGSALTTRRFKTADVLVKARVRFAEREITRQWVIA